MRNPRGKSRRRQPVARHKMHITKGDRVRVIRGEDAGTEGTVLRVLPKVNRVVIEGVKGIVQGKNAMFIQSNLEAYLDPKSRGLAGKGEAAAAN